MTTQTPCADGATLGGAFGVVPVSWHGWMADSVALPDFGLVEPLTVPAIAESAEAVIEDLDAPLAAAPALLDGLGVADPEAGDVPTGSGSREATVPLVVRVWRNQDTRPFIEGTVAGAGVSKGRAISVDEYAKAVLYNGLGHYQAARAAAQRACVSATTSRCSKGRWPSSSRRASAAEAADVLWRRCEGWRRGLRSVGRRGRWGLPPARGPCWATMSAPRATTSRRSSG